MTRKSATSNNVLRDIVLHTEPHTLSKPGRAPTKPAMAPELPNRPPVVPAPLLRSERLETDLAHEREQARQAGHREGYQAGFQEGTTAGLNQWHQQGYDDGFLRGKEEGEKSATVALTQATASLSKNAREQTAEQARQVETILLSLRGQLSQRLAAVEDDMVAVCFEAICAILGNKAATPDGVRQHVQHALQSCQARQQVVAHLHPHDASLLREHLREEDDRLAGIQIVGDPGIVLGGCILRSPEGGLDARLETQIEALRQVLLRCRASVDAAAGERA